jgi:hypothetical protein
LPERSSTVCPPLDGADGRYNPKDSRTNTASQRALSATSIFPTSEGSIDLIQTNGNLVTERITDPRDDSYDRVVGVINEVDEVTVLGQRTRAANLPEGVSGFFGLGVNQVSLYLRWVTRGLMTGSQAMVNHA